VQQAVWRVARLTSLSPADRFRQRFDLAQLSLLSCAALGEMAQGVVS
jgi:hypothetical protein